jgi:hypothetical protein
MRRRRCSALGVLWDVAVWLVVVAIGSLSIALAVALVAWADTL